jgi:hypothetical protein
VSAAHIVLRKSSGAEGIDGVPSLGHLDSTMTVEYPQGEYPDLKILLLPKLEPFETEASTKIHSTKSFGACEKV